MRITQHVALLSVLALSAAPAAAHAVSWPTTSGDQGAMRYSPLDDVNRTNVGRLAVAWRWNTGEKSVRASATQKAARPGLF
jgi:glucose dehydrogenase